LFAFAPNLFFPLRGENNGAIFRRRARVAAMVGALAHLDLSSDIHRRNGRL